MKNLANIAMIAIASLTFEACSSTRASSGSNSTNDAAGTVTPASGDATSVSSGSGSGSSTTGSSGTTTGSGTGTSGTGTSGTGTSGSTTGSGGTTTGTGTGTSGSTTGSGGTTTGSGTGTSGSTTGSSTVSSGSGTSGNGNSGMSSNSTDETQLFIQQAAISGMSEVQLSRLALKNAQSSAVKQFAAMMVKDHGGANAELKALATAKGITLPDSSALNDPANSNMGTGTATSGTATGTSGSSTGTAGSSTGTAGSSTGTAGSGTGNSDNTSGGINMSLAEKTERLRTSSTKEFDQNYIQLMIRDHVKAVSLFERGSKSSDPQVKAYATKHLPTLRMHLQHVTALGKTTIGQSGGK